MHVLVAQWLERWSSEPKVGGSSPSEDARRPRVPPVRGTGGTRKSERPRKAGWDPPAGGGIAINCLCSFVFVFL